MSAWEAYSFWQWVCGISVGDAINLFFAFATVSVAVLAYRIQKAQKTYSQDQTKIMGLLCAIELKKDKREESTFKNKLFDSILHLTSRVVFDNDNSSPASKEHTNFYALHRKEVPDIFPEEVQALCKMFKDYHATQDGKAKKVIKGNMLEQWILVYNKAEDYF